MNDLINTIKHQLNIDLSGCIAPHLKGIFKIHGVSIENLKLIEKLAFQLKNFKLIKNGASQFAICTPKSKFFQGYNFSNIQWF